MGCSKYLSRHSRSRIAPASLAERVSFGRAGRVQHTRYSLGDLTTTFSEDPLGGHKHRGRRIVLYDGEGDLDRDLEGGTLRRIAYRYGRNFRNGAHRRADVPEQDRY
jgi:hypothetical protein